MEHSEYLELFLSESQEILTTLNQSLIELEKNPSDQGCLESIFRGCHTLKGMAAAMGYHQLVGLAHAMENVLEMLRLEKIRFEQSMMPVFFDGLDALATLIDAIKQGKEGTIDEPELRQLHDRLTQLSSQSYAATASEPSTPSLPETTPILSTPVTENLTDTSMPAALSVRVNIDRIESLLNTVGELHINKIRLAELSRHIDDEQLSEAIVQMERIANKLQDETMQIRFLPLNYLLQYFPRMVRDAAHEEGKEVNFQVTGADIGVDRTILDEIHDPLIHIFRNAVSHGIESPEVRKQNGKPAAGLIEVRARREKNFVILEIHDDGCGINKQAVIDTCLKHSLITTDELSNLTEQEILMLITRPGFSLGSHVTENSGRGIGMNVVKSKLDAIGGLLVIETEPGKGTRFTLTLPISMAIIPALLIACGDEICAIPLYNIIETIRVDPVHIKSMKHQDIVPWRDKVLPLIYLGETLGYTKEVHQNRKEQQLSVVVCEFNHQKAGFVVETFIKQQEILIKNLDDLLGGNTGFSGATILGTGRVAMIVDVGVLMKERLQC